MELHGHGLTVPALVGFARSGGPVTCLPAALVEVARAHHVMTDVAERRPVYGMTTGVGANRSVPAAADGHSLRLLRSHAAGVGPVEDDATTRAAMLVRLNQLLAGGSGVSPGVVRALAEAVGQALPTVHRYGSIGTGDLAALAEIALTLAGDLPWRAGSVPPVEFARTDALAFISSNALTASVAALACADLRVLLGAAHVVAALTFRALRGSPEAYAEAVHRSAYAGQLASAALMRTLLAGPQPAVAQRIQDPFGLRALPQVHGSSLEALQCLERVVTDELNGAHENPLVVPAQGLVLHHGQFHTAALAAALDAARGALHPLLSLSTARLAALVEPELTGVAGALTQGPAGSSGVMVLEYVAQDALAEVRQTVLPVGLGTAVLSRGLEEHASFSTQSARATGTALVHARVVLACELVAAVRVLRAGPGRVGGGPAAEAFALAAGRLDPDPLDRVLGADVAAAMALLPELAQLGQTAASGLSSSA